MKNRSDKFKLAYAFSLTGQLGFFVVISIGVFLFLGRLLDNLFKTAPLFFFIGAVFGTMIVIHGTYKFFLPLMDKESKEQTKTNLKK